MRKRSSGFPTRSDTNWAVTAKLICVFVFAYTKSRFSRDADQIMGVRDMIKLWLEKKMFVHESIKSGCKKTSSNLMTGGPLGRVGKVADFQRS